MFAAPTTVEQTPEIVRARRLLNYVLEAFHLGLAGSEMTEEGEVPESGIVLLGDDATKQKTAELLAFVDGAFTKINDSTVGENLAFAEVLRAIEQQFVVYVDPNAAVVEEVESNVPDFPDFDFDDPLAPAAPAPGA